MRNSLLVKRRCSTVLFFVCVSFFLLREILPAIFRSLRSDLNFGRAVSRSLAQNGACMSSATSGARVPSLRTSQQVLINETFAILNQCSIHSTPSPPSNSASHHRTVTRSFHRCTHDQRPLKLAIDSVSCAVESAGRAREACWSNVTTPWSHIT